MVDLLNDEIPRIVITADMIDAAKKLEDAVRVERTRVSDVDTISGIIGEFAFAHWYRGDWTKHEVGKNQGEADFEGIIEVKSSVIPLSPRLNLPVREDYANARQAEYYVWCCIDIPQNSQIQPGHEAAIVGWATGAEAHSTPPRHMGRVTSYRCHLTPVPNLHSMAEFPPKLKKQ